jgi:hypothetical protein
VVFPFRIGGVFHVKSCVSAMIDLVLLHIPYVVHNTWSQTDWKKLNEIFVWTVVSVERNKIFCWWDVYWTIWCMTLVGINQAPRENDSHRQPVSRYSRKGRLVEHSIVYKYKERKSNSPIFCLKFFTSDYVLWRWKPKIQPMHINLAFSVNVLLTYMTFRPCVVPRANH